jgi:hypothetical protein
MSEIAPQMSPGPTAPTQLEVISSTSRSESVAIRHLRLRQVIATSFSVLAFTGGIDLVSDSPSAAAGVRHHHKRHHHPKKPAFHCEPGDTYHPAIKKCLPKPAPVTETPVPVTGNSTPAPETPAPVNTAPGTCDSGYTYHPDTGQCLPTIGQVIDATCAEPLPRQDPVYPDRCDPPLPNPVATH